MRPSLNFAKNILIGKEVVGAEVGVQFGLNAFDILFHWDKIKTLHLVDSYARADKFTPSWLPFGDAKENLILFKNKIAWHLKTSMQGVLDFEDESLDFVYIDASHKYEDVKDDLAKWWPKVKKGGIFCGHDYTDGDVQKAIQEFAYTKHDLKKEGLDWWILKGEK